MLRIAQFLIVADAALLRASSRGDAVLSASSPPDFLAKTDAKDLMKKCVAVASAGIASPAGTQPACAREFGDPTVCGFMVEQVAIFTAVAKAEGGEASPKKFCGLVVQMTSANAKKDLMDFVPGLERWEVCVNSLLAAMETKAETPEKAIQANAEATCKMEMEQVFERDNLPTQLSGAACTEFIKEVENGLSAGSLNPDDGGQTFCNCAQDTCKVERPLRKASVCDHPVGFPMSEADIPAGAKDAVQAAKDAASKGGPEGVAPVLSMEQFVEMAKAAYGTGHIAFLTGDKNGDGKLSPEEWDELCVALGLEPEDTRHLFKEMDTNGDGEVDAMEFSDAFGVTLEGLRQRLLAKHGNADEGWKAADADGNGYLSPQEFFKHCVEVDVSTANAGKLLPQVDTDGDGKVSPEEYRNAFGVTLDELKKRARDKFGPPAEAFKKFDADGDGEISPEEWEKACEELDIPKDKAAELLKEVDQDGDGKVSEDEFRDSMGMGLEDLKREVFDKLGSYEDALEALDKDGDGEISEEEFKEGLKAQGFGDKEIDDMYDELAGEDGKITEEDFKKATGEDELEKLREEAGLGKKELIPGVKALPVGAEADADGDGEVTKEEYLEAAKAKGISPEDAEIAWAQADPDGDGKASVDAVDAVSDAAKAAAEAFQAADTDGDGKVSEEEFLEHAREQGIPEEEALKAYEKMDKNGDGELSAEEFIYSGGLDKNLDGGSSTPPATDVPDVPMDEVKARVKDAFGETSDAWEAIAGSPDANHMTPEQWEEQAAKLGLSPEQAAEAYKQMDKNGDGKVDFEEFQKAMGVSPEDLKKRMLDKHGNGEKCLEATDTDGDGKVSEDELVKAAMDVGVPEEQARKIWRDHLDPDKDGFMTGEEFLDYFGVDADVMRERMADAGYKDAGEAFKDMDADGSGEVSEEEFVKAAMEKFGVSEEEAKKMFKEADKDGSGGLSEDEFRTAFGVGPDELREACFEHFQDPKLAFHAMDTDGDEVLSPEEWEKGLAQMDFNTDQAKHLFKLADTNNGEHTQGMLSRFEFWTFLRYRPHHPHFMYYWGKYYGDLDRWGYTHQHHNQLTHEMLEPKKSFLASPVLQ